MDSKILLPPLLTRLTLLPKGTLPQARHLIFSRSLRAFADGYVVILLPYYLTLLGFSATKIGLLLTATLLGSGLMTLSIGFIAHRFPTRSLLFGASFLMCLTGIGMVECHEFWPLMLVAIFGTINPSGGDVSIFLPLEQSLLTQYSSASSRTALFARFSLFAGLASALGSQAAALPTLLSDWSGLSLKNIFEIMFLAYSLCGLSTLSLYRCLPVDKTALPPSKNHKPLGVSRSRVYALAAVFSIDAFGSGFAVQSLLALWLYQKFGIGLTQIGSIMMASSLLASLSFMVAPYLAQRIGLLNTMVLTHIPANVFLILVPFMPNYPSAVALLLLRAALSSMDVPTRNSYVMAVVTPPERPAAASLTNVPRSLASALSPALAGYMLSISSFGWPLVVCGCLKILYDLVLWKMFKSVKPPEENQL